VALTRCEQVGEDTLAALEREVARHTRAPLLRIALRPVRLETGGGTQDLATLAGQPVLALAGVGRPQAFRRTLEALGAEVRATHFLPDHGVLPQGGLARVLEAARRAGAARVVTTRKDAVKLPVPLPAGVAVLEVVAEVVAGAPALEAALDRVLAPPGA
jgi:tetraacyldisaccharide 4'-kinase